MTQRGLRDHQRSPRITSGLPRRETRESVVGNARKGGVSAFFIAQSACILCLVLALPSVGTVKGQNETRRPLGPQHQVGLAVSLLVPPAPQPEGASIIVSAQIENQDGDHPADIQLRVEQPLGFGNFVVVRSCDRDTVAAGDPRPGDGLLRLEANDGVTGAGLDFTTCQFQVCGLFELSCPSGRLVEFAIGIVADATDGDPVPQGQGGFGGLTFSASSGNSVIGLCTTPTPTRTPTATTTATPTSSRARRRGAPQGGSLSNVPPQTGTGPCAACVPTLPN